MGLGPHQIGIRASIPVVLPKFLFCFSKVYSSSSVILYKLMRILFACHIWLERSIFLVSSKKSGLWFRVFYSEIFVIYCANINLSESCKFSGSYSKWLQDIKGTPIVLIYNMSLLSWGNLMKFSIKRWIKFLIRFQPLQFKVIEADKQSFARNMIPMIIIQHL